MSPTRLSALLTLCICVVISASSLAAQQYRKQDLQEKLDKKLSQAFVKHVAWKQNYTEARREAARTKRPVFVYFTRSFAP